MRVIVVGASAGGVEALTELVNGLPADLAAAVLVVLHFPERSISHLPEILNRRSKIPARHAVQGETIEAGTLYVAPPGLHMLLKGGRISLNQGAKENGHRPAIDPLFRSAAQACGHDAIAVLLSGLLNDGMLGMSAIKRAGGICVAQDPDDAIFGDMPRSAIQSVGMDYVVTASQMPTLLTELVEKDPPVPPTPAGQDTDPAEMNMDELSHLEAGGNPSVYTCPECHGTLFELNEEGVVHFRCRVGHAYSFEALEADQLINVETAMWVALRSLEESISLRERMLDRARRRGSRTLTEHYERAIKTQCTQAEIIRSVLTNRPTG